MQTRKKVSKGDLEEWEGIKERERIISQQKMDNIVDNMCVKLRAADLCFDQTLDQGICNPSQLIFMDRFRRHSRLESLDLEGIAKLISSGQVKRIVTMVGAGISTAAGIPDFRSPNSGVYDNLQEFNLPYPMAVFTLDYFQRDPRAFFEVSRRLYRPEAKNVDNLERLSGLPEDKFIEAHGTFNTGHCMKCKTEYNFNYMRGKIINKLSPKTDRILAKEVPTCSVHNCRGVVKPGNFEFNSLSMHPIMYLFQTDVVLFGENLPRKFYANYARDFSACDLLIIMGTSLQVLPFCGLIHRVATNVPRLYLNRDYNSDQSTVR
ncbi:unnamed protein product [Echinostoma caproni]|uniref:Deacetylase sirtuin-type domain-containing protein n=1 Tax=Echinostoma caproni TaxID=27848 RepID=A0A183ANZ9_9TREM|nr:unnamed protein product [Echinostoma caproni]